MPNPHPGPECPWYRFAEIFGAPNIKWCEETLCAWISEPANAISNISYIIVSILILKGARSEWRRGFAMCVFTMGFFSFIYHLSNFFLSQVLDFVGMFLLFSFLIFYNLSHLGFLKNIKALLFVTCYTTFLTIVLYLMHAVFLPFQLLVILNVLIIVGLEIFIARKSDIPKKEMILAIISITVAAVFSYLDHSHIWCHSQNHFVQFHAIWHIFSAVAVWYVFRFQSLRHEET